MINLDDYTKLPTYNEGGTHETDSLSGWRAIGGFFLRQTIIYVAVKWSIIGIIVVTVGLFSTKAINYEAVEKVSSDIASGWYFDAPEILARMFDSKSVTFNAHPVYTSEAILAYEKKTGKDFKKIFWFVIYDGKEYLLMRDTVAEPTGKKKEIDLSNWKPKFLGYEDAETVCESYGGFVPPQELVFKSNKLLDRIKAPKTNEMFADTESDKGTFRCALDISDFTPAK